MLTDIRIQNLRSFKDTGFINLKPINILVGANSSGKSTFLRSFLLMTQSVTKHLRGPIAWFDDALVDFGDFETSKNTNAGKDEKIVFSYSLSDMHMYRTHTLRLFSHSVSLLSNAFKKCTVEISYWNDVKGTFISKVVLKFENSIFEISVEDRTSVLSMSVEGRKIESHPLMWLQNTEEGILPRMVFKDNRPVQSGSILDLFLGKKVMDAIKKVCGKRFTHYERLYPILKKWDLNKSTFLKNLHSFKEIKTLHREILSWTVSTPLFLDIYNGLLTMFIFSIWPMISVNLASYFRNCDYVAPLRAEASRYYRNQGLQVNRIDAYGRNLSEFIDSLSERQRDSFNAFLYSTLGIKIQVRNLAGHLSIYVRENNVDTNIADVGFGYSQILPIITKLWFVQERTRFVQMDFFKQPFVTSLIEQPELHLHPALQAKLADAIARVALFSDDSDNKTRIILETHSPTIINRIGRRIREGVLSPSDVNVLIFNKSKADGNSEVIQTHYNERGQIQEWPYGFFDPSDDNF